MREFGAGTRRGVVGIGIGCVAMLVLALTPAAAGAANITVTSNLDNGTGCTLREAIASANAGSATGCTNGDAGADTISFDSTQFPPAGAVETINLTSGELAIDSNVTIQGYGSDQLTVDGATGSRVFHVNSAGIAAISGMKVTGGSLSGLAIERGGGILNDGVLTLDHVCVCANTIASTTSGSGTLARADGAGIATTGTGNLTVTGSVIDGNHASVTQSSATGGGITVSEGGGIFQGDASGPTVTISDSTVSNNSVSATKTNSAATVSAQGGGVAVHTPLNVSRSTFNDNLADGASTGGTFARGGGIFLSSGSGSPSSSMQLSTVADNRTEGSAGMFLPTESGGGVNDDTHSLSVVSSTISRNGSTSTTPTEGLNVGSDFGTVTFENSIVSNPVRGPSEGGANCVLGDDLVSAGFNDDYTPAVASAGSCGFGEATDKTADPMLDAAGLAANGGPTETIALQTGSPMIDAGSNAGQSSAGIDQRGLARPSDFLAIANAVNGTDIGAFEVQSPVQPPATQPPATTGPTGQRAAALKKCKKKKSKKARKKCKRKAALLPV
jgi:hypothetical protein